MNNYIKKLAKDNIKKNMKFYKYIFLSIFFTFLIIIVMSNLSVSIEKINYNVRAKTYGAWDAIIETDNEEFKAEYEKYAKQYGYQYYGGEIVYNNNVIGNIGYYDTNGYEFANFQYLKGHKPIKENEIVLEETISKLLNAPIDSIVEIHYTYKDKDYFNKYTVVGIINDYTNNWSYKGLSAIVYKMENVTEDLMLKDPNVLSLWNRLENSDLQIVIDEGYDENGNYYSIASTAAFCCNENNYPNIVHSDWGGYIMADTPLTTIALEIIVISLISVFITMLSSLSKRESQFILLRSIGMTFKQLRRLIITEGLILIIIALLTSLIIGMILSALIMFIYSLIFQVSFTFSINLSMLLIELFISFISSYIGVFLPSLTIYELPLTSRNGQFIYHPHKKKIRKPTYFSFIKNEFSRNKIYTALILFITVFLITRSMMLIAMINDYQNDYEKEMNKIYDADLYFNSYEKLDLSSNEKIDVYKDKEFQALLIFDDMNADNYRNDVSCHIVTIEDDPILEEYLIRQGYDGDFKLKDDEVIVVIPNHNYYTYDTYAVDSIRKEDGNYPKDIGLQKGKTLSIIHEIDIEDDTIYDGLYINSVIHINEESVREFLDDYTIIVNEKTLDKISSYLFYDEYYKYYININDNKERSNILNYLVNNGITSNNYFVDSQKERATALNVLTEQFHENVVFSLVMFVFFIFLISLLRMLSSNQLKGDIGLLNILGMTKKRILSIHVIYSTGLFVVASLIGYGWLIVFDTVVVMNTFSKLLLFITYIIYLMCLIMPVCNILKEKSLEIVR